MSPRGTASRSCCKGLDPEDYDGPANGISTEALSTSNLNTIVHTDAGCHGSYPAITYTQAHIHHPETKN